MQETSTQDAGMQTASTQTAGTAMQLQHVVPLNQTTDYLLQKATVISRSSIVPEQFRGKPYDIIAVWEMGREYGMTPFRALQNFDMIKGRCTMKTRVLHGLAKAMPEFEQDWYEFDEATKTAYCYIKRKGCDKPFIGQFSEAEAKQAGVWGRNAWVGFWRTMLELRATKFAVNKAFPELAAGVATTEEIADLHGIPAPGYGSTEPRADDALVPDDLASVMQRIRTASTLEQLKGIGQSITGMTITEVQSDLLRAVYKQQHEYLRAQVGVVEAVEEQTVVQDT